jgi:RNA polymerase sigma-70 factor, ECF subfamily
MEFETIYNQYWDRIFRLCMGYVNDEELAKDLCQETFIKVWKNLSSFRGDSAITTWIFRIATNTCLRQIERNKIRISNKLNEDLAEEKLPDKESQIKLLYRFISELPEVDRIIISLELDNINQSEIAQIVGLSPGNIRVRIHRIKDQLTKKFQQHASQY